MRELHLFAGVGGGILGGMLLGHRCVGAVEIDPYCRRVLEARQRDGILEPFPIHDDIRTFDATAWRGRVDVVCGGFPCQDVSAAGKQQGLDGARSGLWFEMARVVREIRPQFVFVENVGGLLVRGMDRVLGELAGLGFDAEWCVRSAADVGAPHLRKRVWLLAWYANRQHESALKPLPGEQPSDAGRGCIHDASTTADAKSIGREGGANGNGLHCSPSQGGDGEPIRSSDGVAAMADADSARLSFERTGWWATEPRVGRVADGVPARVDRLRALGNAQVPAVAAAAFRHLMARMA